LDRIGDSVAIVDVLRFLLYLFLVTVGVFARLPILAAACSAIGMAYALRGLPSHVGAGYSRQCATKLKAT
jgi:hypothetical protein